MVPFTQTLLILVALTQALGMLAVVVYHLRRVRDEEPQLDTPLSDEDPLPSFLASPPPSPSDTTPPPFTDTTTIPTESDNS